MKIGDCVSIDGGYYYVVNNDPNVCLCDSNGYITVYRSKREEIKLIAEIKIKIGEYLNNGSKFISVCTYGLRMEQMGTTFYIPFNKLKEMNLYTQIKQGESEMNKDLECSYCPNRLAPTPLDLEALELAKKQAINNALAEKQRQYEASIKEYMELEKKRVELTEKCKAMEKVLKITPAFKRSMF